MIPIIFANLNSSNPLDKFNLSDNVSKTYKSLSEIKIKKNKNNPKKTNIAEKFTKFFIIFCPILKIKNCTNNVNIKDKFGRTPIFLAARNGFLDCVKMKKNVKGETALKIALSMEHYDIVFLIREATGIKQGDGTDGEEEVHVSTKIKTIWDAARYGDLDTLKQKLNANEISNINDSNELKFGQKRKLLHIATATGKTHVVKFLLEKGADVNVVDKFKRTPLFFAAVSTFCPCSSVPVKKKTSYLSRRLNLAITSHANVVYA